MRQTPLLTNLPRQVTRGLRALPYRYPLVRRAMRSMPRLVALTRQLLGQQDPVAQGYDEWISRFDTLHEGDEEAILAHIASLSEQPRIAIVMPVHETPARVLRATIESVRAQLWPAWQLCIADDASASPHVTQVLAEYAADPRIRVLRRERRGHISAASNSALDMADADWVALLDHDDLLPRQALYRVALEILAHPEAQVIYSDEDKTDGTGHRYAPYLKPASFDPDLLLGHNLISHFGVYRRALLQAVGGLRPGFEGSQDYDLALRAVAAAGAARVRHVPAVLYHWRQEAGHGFSDAAPERCVLAARRAIDEHLRQRGAAAAQALPVPTRPFWTRIAWPLPSPAPLASIILLAEESMAPQAAARLRQATDYPALEILVPLPYQPATPPPTGLRWVAAPGADGWAALANRAAAAAAGQVLVLLGGDCLPEEADWLRELASQALRPEIGVVGGKLISEQGHVRQAGLVLGVAGLAAPAYRGASAEEPGYMGGLVLARRVSALGPECLALRRDLLLAAGGFAEGVLSPLAAMELCLRLNAAGHATLWTPFATIVQRGPEPEGELAERFPQAAAALRQRWGATLEMDPWLSPWLTLEAGRPTPRTEMPGPAVARLPATGGGAHSL